MCLWISFGSSLKEVTIFLEKNVNVYILIDLKIKWRAHTGFEKKLGVV